MARGAGAARGQRRGRGRVGGAPAEASTRRGRGRGRGRTGSGGTAADFLKPHTAGEAGKIANAEAGAEYNPEIRQQRQDAKGSRARERDLGSWYAQLAADYQNAQNAGSAALAGVEDTSSRQLAEAAARGSADLSALGSSDEAFAKLVGGPKDTEGLAKIAQAGAAADRARVDQAKLPISEQANFVARLGGEKSAARMQGIEARLAERKRRDKIRSDLAATRKDKGRARVGKKEEIRQADRGYSLDLKNLRLSKQEQRASEQQAAADAALAQIESSRQAEQDAIGNRQEEERIGISRRNARTGEKSQRASARNAREDNKGGLSTAEKRARGEHQSDAMSAAKALLAVKVPKSPKEWAQFQAALIEKLGSSYSSEASRAVAQIRATQKQKASTRSRKMHQGKIRGH